MEKSIRWQLKMLRAKRKWTQDDLGKNTGITRWRINQIEVGRIPPTGDERKLLAKALGTRELGL